MKRIYFMIIALSLFFISCGSTVLEPEITADEDFIDAGWIEFEVGNYSAAIGEFSSALDTDSTALEAYSGIGWSQIRLGNIDSAEINFVVALDRNYEGK